MPAICHQCENEDHTDCSATFVDLSADEAENQLCAYHAAVTALQALSEDDAQSAMSEAGHLGAKRTVEAPRFFP